MSRRSRAILLAVGLLVVMVFLAAQAGVPYVTVSPGPTVNVLGEINGKPIVRVKGHKTYPTEGQLRLTTVSVTSPEQKVNLMEAIGAWMRSDKAVLPFKAMYPDSNSAEQERAESAAQMVNSQDTAIATALTELGYHLSTYAEVTGVTPGGPSSGVLKARDQILKLNGKQIEDVEQVFAALQDTKPGEKVSGVVLRNKKQVPFEVTTGKAPDDPNRAILGILVGTGYEFPFEVKVALGENIGGPSAGLMFALSVYDTLTPGALTGGDVIAGTGTISADGSVGPIGGIRQKIVGAKEAGAKLFFVPPDNCDTAVLAPVDPDEIRLVRADTMHSAVQSLEKYAADPSADLPRCPQ
jgi:PDZ domain-containing protein